MTLRAGSGEDVALPHRVVQVARRGGRLLVQAAQAKGERVVLRLSHDSCSRACLSSSRVGAKGRSEATELGLSKVRLTELRAELLAEAHLEVVHALVDAEVGSVRTNATLLVTSEVQVLALREISTLAVESGSSTSKVQTVENAFAHLVEKGVGLLLVLSPIVALGLLLEALEVLNRRFILALEALELGLGVLLRREEVALLLVPLSTVGLVVQNELGLLGLHSLALVLQLVVLLLENLLFAVELALHLFDLAIALLLDLINIILEAVSVLLDPFNLLLEATVLRHHVLGAQLQSLVQALVLLLEAADGLLKLANLLLAALSGFLQVLFELDLQLRHHRVMVMLMLALALALRLLKLIDSLLELLKSFLVVLLGLLFLLLEELELALPKGLLLFEFVLQFRVGALHLVVLSLPVVHLVTNADLALGEGCVQLLVLLLELLVLDLEVLYQVIARSLQVLVFLLLDSLVSLKLRLSLLDVLLQFLESLALLLVLGLDVLLLLLNAGKALAKSL
mmetsp:Transcript_9207/g.13955  ORF Transcript_9207/g.13955 Transcript_9207/m.13955 type:complete len:511 (-) Transcript_9207:3620-5152(-)